MTVAGSWFGTLRWRHARKVDTGLTDPDAGHVTLRVTGKRQAAAEFFERISTRGIRRGTQDIQIVSM